MSKRKLKVVVISDLHLGTYGCHAKEILEYLKDIDPQILVLNGDIIDIWSFSKSYFPQSHIQVLRQILKMTEKGTKTFYITGNHDEAMRKYSRTQIGNFILDDKLILELEEKKVWIFHGDVFDNSTKGWAKILARLGGKGYDILIRINMLINEILRYFGKEKISLSKKVKDGVKKAVQHISDFETIAAELATEQGYDVVICGHIHQPQKRNITSIHGNILYLNSGDWVENCTALEYQNGDWSIYRHPINNAITELVHNEIEDQREEMVEIYDLVYMLSKGKYFEKEI